MDKEKLQKIYNLMVRDGHVTNPEVNTYDKWLSHWSKPENQGGMYDFLSTTKSKVNNTFYVTKPREEWIGSTFGSEKKKPEEVSSPVSLQQSATASPATPQTRSSQAPAAQGSGPKGWGKSSLPQISNERLAVLSKQGPNADPQNPIVRNADGTWSGDAGDGLSPEDAGQVMKMKGRPIQGKPGLENVEWGGRKFVKGPAGVVEVKDEFWKQLGGGEEEYLGPGFSKMPGYSQKTAEDLASGKVKGGGFIMPGDDGGNTVQSKIPDFTGETRVETTPDRMVEKPGLAEANQKFKDEEYQAWRGESALRVSNNIKRLLREKEYGATQAREAIPDSPTVTARHQDFVKRVQAIQADQKMSPYERDVRSLRLAYKEGSDLLGDRNNEIWNDLSRAEAEMRMRDPQGWDRMIQQDKERQFEGLRALKREYILPGDNMLTPGHRADKQLINEALDNGGVGLDDDAIAEAKMWNEASVAQEKLAAMKARFEKGAATEEEMREAERMAARVTEDATKLKDKRLAIVKEQMDAAGLALGQPNLTSMQRKAAQAIYDRYSKIYKGFLDPQSQVTEVYATNKGEIDAVAKPGESTLDSMRRYLGNLLFEKKQLMQRTDHDESWVRGALDEVGGLTFWAWNDDEKRLAEVEGKINAISPVVLLNEYNPGEMKGVAGVASTLGRHAIDSFSNTLWGESVLGRNLSSSSNEEKAANVAEMMMAVGLDPQKDITSPSKARFMEDKEGPGWLSVEHLGDLAGMLPAMAMQTSVGGGILKATGAGKAFNALRVAANNAPKAKWLANAVVSALETGAKYKATGLTFKEQEHFFNFATGVGGGLGGSLTGTFLSKVAGTRMKNFVLDNFNRAMGDAGSRAERFAIQTIASIPERVGAGVGSVVGQLGEGTLRGIQEIGGGSTIDGLARIWSDSDVAATWHEAVANQFGRDLDERLGFFADMFFMGMLHGGGEIGRAARARAEELRQQLPEPIRGQADQIVEDMGALGDNLVEQVHANEVESLKEERKSLEQTLDSREATTEEKSAAWDRMEAIDQRIAELEQPIPGREPEPPATTEPANTEKDWWENVDVDGTWDELNDAMSKVYDMASVDGMTAEERNYLTQWGHTIRSMRDRRYHMDRGDVDSQGEPLEAFYDRVIASSIKSLPKRPQNPSWSRGMGEETALPAEEQAVRETPATPAEPEITNTSTPVEPQDRPKPKEEAPEQPASEPVVEPPVSGKRKINIDGEEIDLDIDQADLDILAKPQEPVVEPAAEPIAEPQEPVNPLETPGTRQEVRRDSEIASQITEFFNNLAGTIGENAVEKVKEYADRIIAGEPRERIIEGLPEAWVKGIDEAVNMQKGAEPPAKPSEPTTETPAVEQKPAVVEKVNVGGEEIEVDLDGIDLDFEEASAEPVAPETPAAPQAEPVQESKPKTRDSEIADQITQFFNNLAGVVGEAAKDKISEYIDRIVAGEPREKAIEGLPPNWVEAIDKGVELKGGTKSATSAPVEPIQEAFTPGEDIEFLQGPKGRQTKRSGKVLKVRDDGKYEVETTVGGEKTTAIVSPESIQRPGSSLFQSSDPMREKAAALGERVRAALEPRGKMTRENFDSVMNQVAKRELPKDVLDHAWESVQPKPPKPSVEPKPKAEPPKPKTGGVTAKESKAGAGSKPKAPKNPALETERKRLSTELEDNFGLSRPVAQRVSTIMGAVAKSMAKMGIAKSPEEYLQGLSIGSGIESSGSLKQVTMPDGSKAQGRSVPPEVINGFYSPIEKKVGEFRGGKQSARKWLDLIGKGDEAVWTGVMDWLERKRPDEQVSSEDVMRFMKDNRIQIVEVVKGGGVSKRTIDRIEELQRIRQSRRFTAEEAQEFDRLNAQAHTSIGDNTKYGQQQLDGEKSNYKEVLITLPASKEVGYKSSHWSEKDIVVHLRMNTRVAADGKKVLFIEEVQSDWGQEGKKKKFRGEPIMLGNRVEGYTPEGYEWRKEIRPKVSYVIHQLVESKTGNVVAEAGTRIEALKKSGLTPIPAAPWVTDTNAWVKLGLRVAMKEAVAQGADRIAWTTGEQQNERYDLSKQVRSVGWFTTPGKKHVDIVDLEGDRVEMEVDSNSGKITSAKRQPTWEGQTLDSVVGKDIADRILGEVEGDLSGEGLRVGGKGMKGFYGSPAEGNLGIVGSQMKALTKQEPGRTRLNKGKDYRTSGMFQIQKYDGAPEPWAVAKGGEIIGWFKTSEEAQSFKNKAYDEYATEYSDQHSIEVTPELRKQVGEGLPLFQNANAQYRVEQGKRVAEVLKKLEEGQAESAALHEVVGHDSLFNIIDAAKGGNKNARNLLDTVVGEYNKARKKSMTAENAITGNDLMAAGQTIPENYRSLQEFFARGMEKYFHEGPKGFSKKMQDIFEAVKQTFIQLYGAIANGQLDVELTDKLRLAFGAILGKGSDIKAVMHAAEYVGGVESGRIRDYGGYTSMMRYITERSKGMKEVLDNAKRTYKVIGLNQIYKEALERMGSEPADWFAKYNELMGSTPRDVDPSVFNTQRFMLSDLMMKTLDKLDEVAAVEMDPKVRDDMAAARMEMSKSAQDLLELGWKVANQSGRVGAAMKIILESAGGITGHLARSLPHRIDAAWHNLTSEDIKNKKGEPNTRRNKANAERNRKTKETREGLNNDREVAGNEVASSDPIEEVIENITNEQAQSTRQAPPSRPKVQSQSSARSKALDFLKGGGSQSLFQTSPQEFLEAVGDYGWHLIDKGVTDKAKWMDRMRRELPGVEDNVLDRVWSDHKVDGLSLESRAADAQANKDAKKAEMAAQARESIVNDIADFAAGKAREPKEPKAPTMKSKAMKTVKDFLNRTDGLEGDYAELERKLVRDGLTPEEASRVSDNVAQTWEDRLVGMGKPGTPSKGRPRTVRQKIRAAIAKGGGREATISRLQSEAGLTPGEAQKVVDGNVDQVDKAVEDAAKRVIEGRKSSAPRAENPVRQAIRDHFKKGADPNITLKQRIMEAGLSESDANRVVTATETEFANRMKERAAQRVNALKKRANDPNRERMPDERRVAEAVELAMPGKSDAEKRKAVRDVIEAGREHFRKGKPDTDTKTFAQRVAEKTNLSEREAGELLKIAKAGRPGGTMAKVIEALKDRELTDDQVRDILADRLDLPERLTDMELSWLRGAEATMSTLPEGITRGILGDAITRFVEVRRPIDANQWVRHLYSIMSSLFYGSTLSGMSATIRNLGGAVIQGELKPLMHVISPSQWYRAISKGVQSKSVAEGFKQFAAWNPLTAAVMVDYAMQARGAKKGWTMFWNALKQGSGANKYEQGSADILGHQTSALEKLGKDWRGFYKWALGGRGKKGAPIEAANRLINAWEAWGEFANWTGFMGRGVGRFMGAQDIAMFTMYAEPEIAKAIMRARLEEGRLSGNTDLTKIFNEAKKAMALDTPEYQKALEDAEIEVSSMAEFIPGMDRSTKAGARAFDRMVRTRAIEMLRQRVVPEDIGLDVETPTTEQVNNRRMVKELAQASDIAKSRIFTYKRNGVVGQMGNTIKGALTAFPLTELALKPIFPYIDIAANVLENAFDANPFSGWARANGLTASQAIARLADVLGPSYAKLAPGSSRMAHERQTFKRLATAQAEQLWHEQMTTWWTSIGTTVLMAALLRNNRDDKDKWFDIYGPKHPDKPMMMKIGSVEFSYKDLPELLIPASMAFEYNDMLEHQGKELEEAGKAEGLWAKLMLYKDIITPHYTQAVAAPLQNSMLEGVVKVSDIIHGGVMAFRGATPAERKAAGDEFISNALDIYAGYLTKSTPVIGALNNAFVRDAWQLFDESTISTKTAYQSAMYNTFGVAWSKLSRYSPDVVKGVIGEAVQGVDYRGNKVTKRPWTSIFNIDGKVNNNLLTQYLFPVDGDPAQVQGDMQLMSDLGITLVKRGAMEYFTEPTDDSYFLGLEKMNERQVTKLNELAGKKFGQWLDAIRDGGNSWYGDRDKSDFEYALELSREQTPERENKLKKELTKLMTKWREAARNEMQAIDISEGGFVVDGKNTFVKMK